VTGTFAQTKETMLQGALFTLAITLISVCAVAQPGSISGIVTDGKSGETIVGANVVIDGTTVGAATDIEGNFQIDNVKPGVYNLNVSFVTYKTHVIPDVVVESGRKTALRVTLVEDATELKEVVVTAWREINTDYALLGAIRESKLVVSGISAEQIGKSQDRDAAQVVRRVPGVTIQDNRFVVVRGLASRYSNVILNGVIAPSTEADSRAFSFDIIPSGLLDRMLVYKSGSAELPGDFAGSVIQINTKGAVEENFTNFSVGTGHRFNTTFTTQQTQQRSPTEWLGFDNGMRDLPESAPADYRSLGVNTTLIETESRKFQNTWQLDKITVNPDMRVSFDLGRSFDVGRLRISTIGALTYSNTNQFNEIGFNRYQNYTDNGDGDQTSDDFFRYFDDQFTNNVRLGALSNWTFRYSSNSRIEFRNLYNRLGTTQTTIREGNNYFRDAYYRNYSMRYVERGIYSGQVEGNHNLRNDKSQLTWMIGYTNAQRNEPDWKRLVTVQSTGASEQSPFIVVIPFSTSASNAARFYQTLDEYSITHRLDFDHKIIRAKGKDPFEIKAGYWLEYKDRSFAARSLGHVVRSGFDQQGPIGSLPFDQIFDPGNVDYNTGHHISENTKVTDSYTASNRLAAAYVRINLPLSPKLKIIPGVRVEHNIQELATPEGIGSAKVENPITSLLPSVNLSYDVSTTSLIRLAYSKTVNRPEFRELAPFSFFDFDNQADIQGNPKLKTANIHNVDLRWEYYPTPGQTISIGTFYKYFIDPIEVNINNGTDNPTFPFNNADKAQNYGLEVEIRKALAYSSRSTFLNNTSVVLNAAYIISEIHLENDGTLLEKDSRPMQGQSPYIVNAGLFYNDDDRGIQANIQYNVSGKRIAFVGLPGIPTWWEMPRHVVDVSVSKSIGRRTELRLGVNDLFNSRQYFVEDANLDNDLTNANTNKVVRSTRGGQYATLSVAFKL